MMAPDPAGPSHRLSQAAQGLARLFVSKAQFGILSA